MKNFIEALSVIDGRIRPYITNLFPHKLAIGLYSSGRMFFLKQLASANIAKRNIDEMYSIKLWDIDFCCGLFNAAGMFKYGEGYEVCAAMGAGAYLAGTTTYLPRTGNEKYGIKHPFVPYPNSHTASNWMGLPNPGHIAVAKRLAKLHKIHGCPIGASIAENPEITNHDERMNGIIAGLKIYDEANVDFIEINLSCPNVEHNTNSICALDSTELDTNMIKNLEYISKQYLSHRRRSLPVIVKLSLDTNIHTLIKAVDMLIDLGFDGINIGNTSTQYAKYLPMIDKRDAKLYKYFTEEIGGGLSGDILKETSLSLCLQVVQYLKHKQLKKEFHCIRTGGVSTAEDLIASRNAGIQLNQWFAGFFDNFAQNGFDTYSVLMNELLKR
jgi:dihydroorotate dehydrogenase (NAD+) catalytic subunit